MVEPTGPMQRFISGWFSRRIAVAIIGSVALILLGVCAPKPVYRISLEGLFPAHNPLIQSQERARSAFGDTRFVLLAYQDPEVLTAEGIKRTAEVEGLLREISAVRDVLCLATLDKQLQLLGSSITAKRGMAERYRQMFTGFTHDSQHSVAGFICLLAPLDDLEEEVQLVAQLRNTISRPPTGLGSGIVVGEPVLVADAYSSIRRDSVRLQFAATLLLALVLAYCLRSLGWVIVVFSIVQLSIWAATGAAGILNLHWSLLSSMFPAIIVVIGAGALTHLAVWSRRLLSEQGSAEAAVMAAVDRLAWPILATCVTDAMGFLALLVSPVVPLREFALMVTLGIFFLLVSSCCLFPLFGCWALRNGALLKEDYRRNTPQNTAAFFVRSRRGLLVYVGIVLIASTGVTRLQLETDITKSFRDDSKLAGSFRFVEQRMGGAGIWEVHIPVEGTLSRSLMIRIGKLSSDLRELQIPIDAAQPNEMERPITNVVSLADVLTAADGTNFLLAAAPMPLRVQGIKTAMPVFYSTMFGQTDDGRRYLRILVRSPDARDVQWKRELIDTVDNMARVQFPIEADENDIRRNEELRVAGTFVVIARMVESLLVDQWRTLGVALVCVLLTLVVFQRRLFVAVIALLPSLMAIIAVLGLIGWCRIHVDLGVVMIAAVSLGLAVDGAIHMLNSIERELARGCPYREAIQLGVRATGGPLTYATIAVVVGFSTLAASDFMPSVTFGLLVGVATTVGLIGNLTVVPTCLCWLGRRHFSLLRPSTSNDVQASPTTENVE
ncbi:MAG: MMPL family transporter [Pirellulaceae bacterium]